MDRPRVKCRDKLLWTGSSDGLSSVKSCYDVIQDNGFDSEFASLVIYRLIWKAKLHERLKLFLWRVLNNVLPTILLFGPGLGKGTKVSPSVGMGKNQLHIFKDCYFIRAIAFASRWGLQLDKVRCNSMEELVKWCLNPHQGISLRGIWKRSCVRYCWFLYFI